MKVYSKSFRMSSYITFLRAVSRLNISYQQSLSPPSRGGSFWVPLVRGPGPDTGLAQVQGNLTSLLLPLLIVQPVVTRRKVLMVLRHLDTIY